MMSTGSLAFVLALGFVVAQGFTSANGQRISQQKCSEYRKLTVKTTTLITLSLKPQPVVYEDYKCPNIVELIVGGEAARTGEFPHQALLGYTGELDPSKTDFRCGGSLISERFVLTAAHCANSDKPTVVRLGENDLRDDDDDQVDFDVDAFIKHPEYTRRKAYHDIALVRLAQDVYFTKLIRPACLWTGDNLNVTTAMATGYGKTEFAGSTSDILMKVKLDILPQSDCSFYGTNNKKKFDRGVIDGQMCVGSLAGGKDTCQGDSGGPLETVNDLKGCMFHIVGVTSVGAACGFEKSPSIYTRVASYIDWIEKTVWV